VGILEGPAVLGWVTAADQIDLLAKAGIALLLFVVFTVGLGHIDLDDSFSVPGAA